MRMRSWWLTSSAVAMAAGELSLNVLVCHHILPPMNLHFTPCCPKIYSCAWRSVSGEILGKLGFHVDISRYFLEIQLKYSILYVFL